ncbi:hypothetical protein [Palleronia rufa]|uniref:hypothetical protein n=1 Tax=Palleronia rufa TaxID=1530186 RepID=UPI00056B2CF0|nr:hypothetical protein [Palleronia rufa]
MIELLFITCLSTAPDQCQERSLIFTDVSAQQCMTDAQPALARWIGTHPAFEIRQWRCRPVPDGTAI